MLFRATSTASILNFVSTAAIASKNNNGAIIVVVMASFVAGVRRKFRQIVHMRFGTMTAVVNRPFKSFVFSSLASENSNSLILRKKKQKRSRKIKNRSAMRTCVV